MTAGKHSVAEQVQRSIDRGMAETMRAVKRRTPAESRAFVAEMGALADQLARQGSEERLDEPSVSKRRGRGKSPRNLALIEAASTILADIQPASIRAICYRLFTLGLIAAMTKGETNRVSSQITWAREQGLIPWGWVVDETRAAERVSAWENPAAYVETVKGAYRRDPKNITV